MMLSFLSNSQMRHHARQTVSKKIDEFVPLKIIAIFYKINIDKNKTMGYIGIVVS